MTLILITNCVSQKAEAGEILSLPEDHAWVDLDQMGEYWKSLLDRSTPDHTFRSLYIGPSPVVARRVARSSGADLMFASCGYGLVSADDEGTSYDLTVSDKTNPLARGLAQLRLETTAWWEWMADHGIGRGRISSLLADDQNSMVLLALPSPYLSLIRDDLKQIQSSDVRRLRVFSSARIGSSLPDLVKPCLMPYDDRLSCIAGYDGPMVTFAQRATAHFVEAIKGQFLSLEEAKLAVSAALAGLKARAKVQRTKASDETLIEAIQKNWDLCGGRAGKLLRYVRDELGLAVEQSRFSGLWQRVRLERE
jgi:hypothetical protein